MTTRRFAAFVAAIVVVLLAAVPAAHAGPTSSTTAIVALGDSFSSGEAGRWQGNSLNFTGTRDGTDRAARCTLGIFCSYDATRVYGSSYDNGCHRADVAPIKSAGDRGQREDQPRLLGRPDEEHLARLAGRPGRSRARRRRPTSCSPIAQQKNVKLILLNISANDLGFTDHVINCTVAWTLGYTCHDAEQASIEAGAAGRADRAAQVGRRDPRRDDGGRLLSSQYKLVMQGYASPIPRRRRHPLSGDGLVAPDDRRLPVLRTSTRTGPRTRPRPRSSTTCARSRPRRACSSSTCGRAERPRGLQQELDAWWTARPSPVTHEWVRWLNSGCCQGDAQESLHPNAYGERAIGKCVSLVYATAERQLDVPEHGRAGLYGDDASVDPVSAG